MKRRPPRSGAFAASVQPFKAILEQMQEGVVTLDRQHRITYANPAAMTLLRLAEQPIERTLLESIRVPDLHDLVSAATADGSRTGEFRPYNEPDAPWLLGRVSVQPERETIVLVLHDVSELHRLETVRQDFVANVSHELRTPVSVILANTETLMNGALDDRQAAEQFIDALRRNAYRLSRVLSDLLELSRLDAGQYPLRATDLMLRALVESVVAAAATEIARKDLAVYIAVPEAAGVQADSKALTQVLANLLDNAVKYTPSGGTVHLSAHPEPGAQRVEISDSGPGIDPQHRERVFERFFRVDAGRSRSMGGTGLGLSIVKNLVEAMGGTVSVGEAACGGACFAVRLPATPRGPDESQRVGVDPLGERASPPLVGILPTLPRAKAFSWESLDADPRVRQLRQRLLLMAGRVEEMVTKAVVALVNGDPELARQTVRMDALTNGDEIEIDQMCLDLLRTAHPKGRKRRFIMLVLKVVVDLERIGDLAVNICERAVDLAMDKLKLPLDGIREMADRVHGMIHTALDAFAGYDAELARSVIRCDDEVDAMYGLVFRRVLASMTQDPQSIQAGIHVQSVAKWLERMADHGTNVAEQVIFMVEGMDVRHRGKLES